MKTIFKSPKETKTSLSKTLITFITIFAVAVTGLVSYHFFRQEEYNASSLLLLTSYLSIVLGVYILTNKKPVLH